MSTATFTTLPGLNRALSKLPREVSAELRDASVRIADTVAVRSRSRAGMVGRGWAYLGPTIRARRDRVPVVAVGGSRRTRQGQPAGEFLMGSEYGGRGRPSTRQFLPHLGNTGYVVWPTVRALGSFINDAYADALGDALERVR